MFTPFLCRYFGLRHFAFYKTGPTGRKLHPQRGPEAEDYCPAVARYDGQALAAFGTWTADGYGGKEEGTATPARRRGDQWPTFEWARGGRERYQQ